MLLSWKRDGAACAGALMLASRLSFDCGLFSSQLQLVQFQLWLDFMSAWQPSLHWERLLWDASPA